MNGRCWSVFAVLLVTGAGCVTIADFEKVKNRQQTMRAVQADLQVDMDTLKSRVEAMQSRLGDTAGAPNGGGAAAAELEERIARLEARAAAQPGIAPAQVTPEVPGSPAAAIALRAEESVLLGRPETDPYRTAVEFYRKGQFEEAIAKFREWLRGEPKSELAANAQYWIGECYYNQRDYNRAIIELNEVLLKYPQADRVPGALLALATAFADSGDKIDARLILQKLIGDHADSEEAGVGRRQLQVLTQ